MKIADLQANPIWGMLPAGVKRVVQKAQDEGWELHGKGVTIAFRFDRDQDELDLPAYMLWQLGTSPTGKVSFTSGKGGVPHQTLSASEMIDYLEDPSVVYPLEPQDEPGSENVPWEDNPKPMSPEALSASLGATEITPGNPVSVGSSPTTASTRTGLRLGGTQSSALSTTTAKPLRVGTKK